MVSPYVSTSGDIVPRTSTAAACAEPLPKLTDNPPPDSIHYQHLPAPQYTFEPEPRTPERTHADREDSPLPSEFGSLQANADAARRRSDRNKGKEKSL